MKKKTKLTATEYNKILKNLNFENIIFKKCNVFFHHRSVPPKNLEIKIDKNVEVNILNDHKSEIHQIYKLLAKKKEAKGNYLKIFITFVVTIKSGDTLTKEFIDIFNDISLDVTTWPYFREFVNNITARMNIPPLVLPFIIKE